MTSCVSSLWRNLLRRDRVERDLDDELVAVLLAESPSPDFDGALAISELLSGRLGYRFGRGSAPGTAWKRFSVRLSASAGWTWNGSGSATEAQLRSVLSSPLSLEIRGEYTTGPDEGFLDNFELQRPE